MPDTQQIAVLWRRIPAYCAMLLAALCLLAIFTTSASAGTYRVYSCSDGTEASIPNDAWLPYLSNSGHASLFTLGAKCSEYSVTTAASAGLAAGENAGLRFTAPSGTTISGYAVRRTLDVTFPASGTRPALSAGLRRTTAAGNTYWGECEAVKTNCSIASSGTQSTGLDATSLQLGVECAEISAPCAAGGFTTLRARLFDARVDIKDLSAPTLALIGGTLPGPHGVTGTHSVSVSANDVGGGVSKIDLSVDGAAPLATQNAGGSCALPYTKPAPCPGSSATSFSLNLATYGTGNHTAVVTATDAAGNVGALAPINFTVGTGAGGGVVANGTPSVEVPSLKTSKSVVSVKSSRKVALRGTLRTSTGRAIGGATLEVNAASLGATAGAPRQIGSVKTAADGSFAYKLKPNGALLVTFVFRPSAGSAETASASTTLRQSIGLTARRSQAQLRRGATLAIAGRLSGAGRAAAGAPVEIQVKNGRRWSTIDTVVASRSGNYKWKHRFTRVTRPTIFTFRAVVRPKQGWPWKSKSSSAVRVLVLG